MKMLKWLVLFVFSFSLIAGCSQNEVKTDKKTAAKQTEQKDEKKQEQQSSEEQKQEQKSQEEKAVDSKSIEQNQEQKQNVEQSQNQEQKAQSQEKSKVVNEPKETPKQENVQQTAENQQSAQGHSEGTPSSVQPAPEPKPEPKPKPEVKTVTISVRDDQSTILGGTEVELQEGDTVFKVLARTMKQKGIQMEYTGSGNGVYVQGINNLYEKDKGSGSGWKYSVNGVVSNMGAGRYGVKQGDKIEWFYTLDYRKENR
ncbi:DUF4430 domain-containing protein [Bacillus rhizoplanae]|uniref:DUF4430 domain-containing protein n=1 Tax=Bacillus rhizoplanae TaxID=2880966 RepID=UPI003D1EF6F8